MQRKCQLSFLLELWVIYTIYAKDVVKYIKEWYGYDVDNYRV